MMDIEDWQSSCSLSITNLYMLDNGICSDITFNMGLDRQPVKAHKFILVSRSHVFYTMFCGEMPELGSTVDIPDIEAHIMKLFLRFLYTEHVELAPDAVTALLYTAKKYGVKSLVDKCSSYLETEIDIDNVCTILEQAHLFDEPNLRSQCLKTIYSKSADVFADSTKDYINLCRECLKQILQSDKLNTPECTIFTACVDWAEQQCTFKGLQLTDVNIRETLGDLLFLIRFPNIDSKVFTELVSVRDILSAEEKLAIYQGYNRSPRDGEATFQGFKFSSRPRDVSDIFRVCRFLDSMGGPFDFWDNDNLYDAISFMTSRDIVLVGVAIFRPFPEGVIRGSLRVYDESNRCRAKRDHLEILNSENEKTADVKFQTPVQIKQNKWYTLTQHMVGAKSYFGVKGQRQVHCDGVYVSFRNSPMDNNNTTIDVGQIPALLYQ